MLLPRVQKGRVKDSSMNYLQVMVCLYDGRSANKKTPFKFQYETAYNLELMSCEPHFNARYEFREFSFYPHSKLVLKVSLFGFYH